MEFLGKLASSGLLGLLLALSLLGGFYIFKKLLEEKDKRLEDAKSYNNAVVEPLKTIQRTLDAIMLALQQRNK